MKKIYFREEYCMACRLCEIACLVAHSKSKKIIKAYKEEFPNLTPRLVIEQNGPLSFAIQCRHCEDAPCIAACVTGAMHRDRKTNAVSHNAEKCVGCWMCIMSCPFGVILRDIKEKKVATKCDLCSDEKILACVNACPNEALICAESIKNKDKKKE
ncbi:MAG: 4Fe-4S ferredoxin [Elusimicrobia bacterium RIFOXYC2_FULL_34_12]|nr:MAG: 4Fe-4S ferredoxin [Elusimicrobia bacterium RIFOXYC2_FULL_34_12]OGS39556.1 MAG: 4Fe-4S ferredoxin [Elusimicrobia bacterium RIFOXYD2_FULL_34_30]HAM38305.1 4Fe-4S ferredoxin [Elusimicrobiota bacterium]